MNHHIGGKKIRCLLGATLVVCCQISVASTPASIFKEPAAGISFTHINGGCFEMGSATAVKIELGKLPKGPRPDELPAHQVCLDDYWIGTYEITLEQWHKIMGGQPPAKEKTLPKALVSKEDADLFIETLNSLSKTSSQQFRLPSEAEWEYACLAGELDITPDTYARRSDLMQYAWYAVPSREEAASRPVGEMLANRYGLSDMLGNLWELTADQYDAKGYQRHKRSKNTTTSKQFSIRGGSYTSAPFSVRCKARNYIVPNDRLPTVGLRLVMEKQS